MSLDVLTAQYYNELIDGIEVVKGKGLVCKEFAKLFVQKDDQERLEFANLAHIIRYTVKAGRTYIGSIRKIMAREGWPYNAERELGFSRHLLLITRKPLCKNCLSAKPTLVDYSKLDLDEAYFQVESNYWQDQRRAMLRTQWFIQQIEQHNWDATAIGQEVLGEIDNHRAAIRFSFGCTAGVIANAKARRHIPHDKMQIKARLNKPQRDYPEGLYFDRPLCKKCQKNVIEV
jgi:hypothetical protein